MNRYAKGARKEREYCKFLKKNGWKIAQRSAGSHSPVDIFAYQEGTELTLPRVLFVQMKAKGGMTKKKKKEFDKLEMATLIWEVIEY